MTYTDVDAIGTKQDPAYGFGRDQDTNSKSSGNPNSPFTASDDSSHSDTGPAGGSNRSGFGVDRYYEELDLPLYATQEEIKSQYKRLVRVHHPDRFLDVNEKAIAEERLKAINEAYRVLSSRAMEGQLVKFMQRELGLVVEPAIIDFGLLERRQQRIATFEVRFEKEVEGVDFVPSEEDSWFRVARVSHIYGADHASLEFEVEANTIGLVAQTYQGWIDIYLDNTMTRVPLTMQVARRSWSAYRPSRRWQLATTFVLAFLLFTVVFAFTNVGSSMQSALPISARSGVDPSTLALSGFNQLAEDQLPALYFSVLEQGLPSIYRVALTDNVIPQRLSTGFQVSALQDRQLFAYLDQQAGQTQLFLYSDLTGRVLQLTNDTAAKSQLAWSSDGNYLAYLVGSDEAARIGLYDIAKKQEFRLPGTVTAGVSHFAWSPDGKTLLFDLWRDEERRVYQMAVPDGELQQLTSFDSWGGTWSPDGREVIVASAQGLYRLDSSGRQLRQISNEAADQPRWSADGLWVAYLTQSIDSAKQEQFLWLMHPDGSAVQQLATNAIWHEWSPTGHTLGYLTGNTPSLANESATVSLANQLYYLWITMPDRVPRLIAEVNEPIFAWGH